MTKPKILLVDDDDFILKLLVDGMSEHFHIDTANNAEAALHKVSTESDYQVVMVDYEMPDIDGLTLLKMISDKYPAVKRIMLTGKTEEEIIPNIKHMDVDRLFYKPWNTDSMIAAINALL